MAANLILGRPTSIHSQNEICCFTAGPWRMNDAVNELRDLPPFDSCCKVGADGFEAFFRWIVLAQDTDK
jgi:hypothetical protein